MRLSRCVKNAVLNITVILDKILKVWMNISDLTENCCNFVLQKWTEMNASKTNFFAIFHGKKLSFPNGTCHLELCWWWKWLRTDVDFDTVLILLVKVSKISFQVVFSATKCRGMRGTCWRNDRLTIVYLMFLMSLLCGCDNEFREMEFYKNLQIQTSGDFYI